VKLEFNLPSFFFFFFFKYPPFSECFFRSIYSNIRMNFGVSLYNISVLLLVGLTFRRKNDMKYELII
jgi:hypothetical protein